MNRQRRALPHRALVLLALSFITTSVQGLESVERIHDEINRTVWQPFQCAFENMDGKALNRLYAKQVVRVTPEGIDTKGAFKVFNETRFDERRRKGGRTSLDFWLDSRATNPMNSYEVGFFRLGATDSSGTTQYYYGQFHILLQKQRGRWKIVQDWDTSTIAGRPISDEDFSRGSPMQNSCL